MKLELYAFLLSKDAYISEISINDDYFRDTANYEEIAYWEEHRALFNFMQKIWREKGGLRHDFNCNYLPMTQEIMNELLKNIPLVSSSGRIAKQHIYMDTVFCRRTLDVLKYQKDKMVVFSPSW